MLRIITLHTIQQIFETEAQAEVGPMAQLAYIRCLTHHFQDLPATRENCVAFTLRFAQMNNGQKSKKYFQELEKAGLVKLTDKTVEFPAIWHRHIEWGKLSQADLETRLMAKSGQSPDDFKAELLKNQTFFDIVGMRHGIKPEDAPKKIAVLIEEFTKEQLATGNKYYNFHEFSRHCLGWISRKLPQIPPKDLKKLGGQLLGW